MKLSLTQATSRVNTEVQAQIDKMPSKNEILRAAERNAYAMISGAENSYVHFIPYINPTTNKAAGIKRIEVTDGPKYDAEADAAGGDPFPDSLNRWIWTVGGLGHIDRDGYQDPWDNKFDPSTGQWDDPTLDVAMTMDGKIVADAITVGILRGITLIGNNIYGNNIYTQNEDGSPGGFFQSGALTGSAGSVYISQGQLTVRNGTTGFAKFVQAYRNPSDDAYEGEYCTIGGSRWYLHYYDGGWHDYSFNTRDLAALMQWWERQ